MGHTTSPITLCQLLTSLYYVPKYQSIEINSGRRTT